VKLAAVLALSFMSFASAAAAQPAGLADVMARAGAYVAEFERRF
jgi:hypothetical protein